MQGLQLPLGVQLSETAGFENYYAGPNAEAVTALRALHTPAAPPLLLLFGSPGSGKTHLLHALTRSAATRLSCAYVPLRRFAAEGTEVLEGLEQADVVCLDDLDTVLADSRWPLALLRFLDQLRAHGGRCALSAGAPPERLPAPLPDLATRLSAAVTYGLKPLSDDDRRAFLRERARMRGLELHEDAARHLLVHLPRDTGSLLEALGALDRAALSARRKITLPFVQKWVRDFERTADNTARVSSDG
ncbi:MAG: DnaA regulatory inactivator Hda [Nevskiales bacterium]|nr:DnaA regulatory inactivator Hda [Nevskiales bacterium]